MAMLNNQMVYIILFLFTDSKTWNSSLLEDLATDEARIFGATAQLHWSPNGQKRIPRPYDSSLNPVATHMSIQLGKRLPTTFQAFTSRRSETKWEAVLSFSFCAFCLRIWFHQISAAICLRYTWICSNQDPMGTLPWSGHCSKESSTMGIRYHQIATNGCYKRFSIGFPTLILIYNYPLVI